LPLVIHSLGHLLFLCTFVFFGESDQTEFFHSIDTSTSNRFLRIDFKLGLSDQRGHGLFRTSIEHRGLFLKLR